MTGPFSGSNFCELCPLISNPVSMRRASQADMAAAARGNTEPDEKNIMDDGDWQTNP